MRKVAAIFSCYHALKSYYFLAFEESVLFNIAWTALFPYFSMSLNSTSSVYQAVLKDYGSDIGVEYYCWNICYCNSIVLLYLIYFKVISAMFEVWIVSAKTSAKL